MQNSSLLIMRKHRKRAQFVLFFCIIVLFGGCDPSERAVERAFYYWRGAYSMETVDYEALADLGVEQLYIRYFDVDWDKEKQYAHPVGRIRFRDKVPQDSLRIVPTVYITYACLRALPDSAVLNLGDRIWQKVEEINRIEQVRGAQGLQIDCDWTARTKEKYFKLLRHLKGKVSAKGQSLSATIRLHQIKDQEASGIPPVEEGLLMCYNIHSPKNPKIQNSIFEKNIAQTYLKRLGNYPLKLNVALPLFGWSVLFRQGRYIGLIKELRDKDLQGMQEIRKISTNLYLVEEAFLLKNQYFYIGDIIRVEEVPAYELEEIAQFIDSQLSQDSICVIFFHYDPTVLTNYERKDLQSIFHTFE